MNVNHAKFQKKFDSRTVPRELPYTPNNGASREEYRMKIKKCNQRAVSVLMCPWPDAIANEWLVSLSLASFPY